MGSYIYSTNQRLLDIHANIEISSFKRKKINRTASLVFNYNALQPQGSGRVSFVVQASAFSSPQLLQGTTINKKKKDRKKIQCCIENAI